MVTKADISDKNRLRASTTTCISEHYLLLAFRPNLTNPPCIECALTHPRVLLFFNAH
jgi:hypothetical protein